MGAFVRYSLLFAVGSEQARSTWATASMSEAGASARSPRSLPSLSSSATSS